MPEVTIKQFGGHIGSFAGDCGVVTIDAGGQRDIVVVDTGASAVWRTKTELKSFVDRQLSTVASRPVTLVTTHFHKDHFDPGNLSTLVITNHVFSRPAASNAGFTPGGANNVAFEPGVHTQRDEQSGCVVRYYVPPGGKSDDQNDQSLVVYVAWEGFSFLSFGDITKDAYRRLVGFVGPLPRATVTKYPHHGNNPTNFIDYYDESLAATAVLISGNSGSDVDKTISALLERNVGAVYCLARTREAKELFVQSWRVTDKPVYICDDATISRQGVSMEGGQHFTTVTTQVTSRRSATSNVWTPVDQSW